MENGKNLSNPDTVSWVQLENRVLFNLILVGLLVIASWIFGYFGISVAWTVFLITLVLMVWKSTFFSLVNQAVLLEEDRVHRKRALQNLETVEWLNIFINKWWLTSSQTIYQLLKEALDPIFFEAKPPFVELIELKHFSVGESTPCIRTIRTYNTKDTSLIPMTDGFIEEEKPKSFVAHQIALEVDIALRSDDFRMVFKTRIGGKGLGIDLDASVEKLNFRGKAYIIIDMNSKYPFPHIPKISITFLNKPDVWFNIRILKSVQMMEVPVLKSWIHSLVMSTLTAAFVDPGKMDIHLFPQQEEMSPNETSDNIQAIGVLTVSVKAYQQGKPAMWNPLTEDTRWCVLYLGDQKHTSGLISTGTEWNDQSSFIIYSSSEDFVLKVKSKRLVNPVTLAEHRVKLSNYDLEKEQVIQVELQKRNPMGTNLSRAPLPGFSLKLDFTPLVSIPKMVGSKEDQVDSLTNDCQEKDELEVLPERCCGVVYVCVHEADLNTLGKSKESFNPYCLILNDRKKVRTTHFVNSETPSWESSVEFLTSDFTQASITFVICNWNDDGLTSDTNMIGFCSFTNLQDNTDICRETLPLTQYVGSEETIGSLTITIAFRNVQSVFQSELSEVLTNLSNLSLPGSSKPKSKKKKIFLGSREGSYDNDIMNLLSLGSGVMELSVLSACELVAKDLNGFSDPYCEVRIDDEVVFKSNIKKKTLFPEWNELITIRLPSKNEFLRVIIWDWDAIGRSDFIGDIVMTLDDVKSHSTKDAPEWFKLQNTKSGSIKLQMRIVFESQNPKRRLESATVCDNLSTSPHVSNCDSKPSEKGQNYVKTTDLLNINNNGTDGLTTKRLTSNDKSCSSGNLLYQDKNLVHSKLSIPESLSKSQSSDGPFEKKYYNCVRGAVKSINNINGKPGEKYLCKIKLARSKTFSQSPVTIAKSSLFIINEDHLDIYLEFKIDLFSQLKPKSSLIIQVISSKKDVIATTTKTLWELLEDIPEKEEMSKTLTLSPEGTVDICMSHGNENKLTADKPKKFKSWSNLKNSA